MILLKGFDLSHWKGAVNFATAKSKGIRFSITKATEGITYTDSTYRPNTDNAKTQDILRGAFHFLRWDCNPEQQAEFFWSVIGHNSLEITPFGDFEENQVYNSQTGKWESVPTPSYALAYLERFLVRLEELSGRVPGIYTGEGFWKAYGSKDARFAHYPLWFAHPDYPNLTYPIVPAPWDDCAIWQYSWVGDEQGNGRYYGAASDGLDMNFATPEQLEILTGKKIDVGETVMWKNNALGLYTDNATWTNTGFDFIVGKINTPAGEPNPNLKPIETKTREQGKIFVGLWDFDQACVDFYVQEKKLGVNSVWPPLDQDWPLQKLIEALRARNPDALFIRVMTQNSKIQKEPGNIVWFAAHKFFERANTWFYQNKGDWKWSILVTSNGFIVASQAGDYANNWAGAWPSCIEQAALLPLDESYPQETDRPSAYIANRTTWEFWYYDLRLPDLILYNGDLATLKAFFGVGGTPGDTIPPSTPVGLTVAVSGTTVLLSWQPATDNVGVAGYGIWKDNVYIKPVKSTGYVDLYVAPGMHTYQVDAFDAAGNHSSRASATATVGEEGGEEVSLEDFNLLKTQVTTLAAQVAELERWRKS